MNHFTRLRLMACCALASIALQAAPVELSSPDGHIRVAVELKAVDGAEGCPVYRISYDGRPVLADSRLGLELAGGPPLNRGLTIAQQSASQHDETWQPVCAERSQIRDHYNQLTLDLREAQAPGRVLRVTFRAYDEGVAFCYTLPSQPAVKDFVIENETTQFRFTADHTTWAVYAAQARYDKAEVPLSQVKPGAERPLPVRVADDVYAAITEAKVVDYARMKLRPAKGLPFTLEAFLDAERNKSSTVSGTAPFSSPWRVVMVAPSPGKLLEQNYLVLNLNDPCALADTSWIKPGKVIREASLTTVGGKACVDFCLQRGLQYIEYDAGWYGFEYDAASDARDVHLDPKRNPVPDSLNLHEVIEYANGKGIGVILYVNHLALEKQADELFPLYEKWGVRGVKFGFVNVGSQKWTSLLHQWIRKAAAHKLLVDIHDEFRNTGYQRTYPNLMTVEGIGGNEEFPSPLHNATLPFTRFLTGPADYTFCWYDKRLKPTHGHQLAISTIYFSPWQFLYWYDKPAAYKGEPELNYWKYLPTTWDETRVLAGEIGRCAVVARRKGAEWYVGAIHPVERAVVPIPLSFLPAGQKFTATIYRDGEPDNPESKAVKIEAQAVDAASVLKVDTPANGGCVVRIVPATR